MKKDTDLSAQKMLDQIVEEHFNHQVIIRDDQVLFCPNCRETETEPYLHHTYVIVYNRPEDARTVVRTTITDDEVMQKFVRSTNCRNPSIRRNGIAIGFYCEHCRVNVELTITQEKGQTFLAWRECDANSRQ
jgi:hypothetical protein